MRTGTCKIFNARIFLGNEYLWIIYLSWLPKNVNLCIKSKHVTLRFASIFSQNIVFHIMRKFINRKQPECNMHPIPIISMRKNSVKRKLYLTEMFVRIFEENDDLFCFICVISSFSKNIY